LALRAAQDDDVPWLRALYASTRSAELAGVPWTDAAKRAFLDQQFALQHVHYLTHFPEADFLVLATPQAPVGRLYLDRRVSPHALVDISLMPDWRGQGLGTILVAHAQALAREAGCALALHVMHANPGAHRLYQRLGFVASGSSQTHLAMRWEPGGGAGAAS
ncbi:GNAT family N-acetyltransferase, partial [Xanthomonas sp. Kuri4-2]